MKHIYLKPSIEVVTVDQTVNILAGTKEYLRPSGDPINIPHDPAAKYHRPDFSASWFDDSFNDGKLDGGLSNSLK